MKKGDKVMILKEYFAPEYQSQWTDEEFGEFVIESLGKKHVVITKPGIVMKWKRKDLEGCLNNDTNER